MIQSRVRVTWTNGKRDIDQTMPTAEVYQFLLPIKNAYVFYGNSSGGVVDEIRDGLLVTVGRIRVTDCTTTQPTTEGPNHHV